MDSEIVGIIGGFILGALLYFMVLAPLHYKNGQVDALNGVIKYEMVKKDDNTTRWAKIGD